MFNTNSTTVVLPSGTKRTPDNLIAHAKRGDLIDGGLYVGTTPGGSVRIARKNQFHTVGACYVTQCESFDRLIARHAS